MFNLFHIVHAEAAAYSAIFRSAGRIAQTKELKVNTDRRLHNARRTCIYSSTKARVRLLELYGTNVRVTARVGLCDRPSGMLYQAICHTSVDVTEVGRIENVIRLPTQLDRTLFTPTEILEQGDITVKNVRTPCYISDAISNVSERGRLADACVG